jgi:hypothetical protein
VPKDIAIYGYIFDVKSGMLKEVPDATTSGKATKVLYVMTAAGHGSGLTYKW